ATYDISWEELNFEFTTFLSYKAQNPCLRIGDDRCWAFSFSANFSACPRSSFTAVLSHNSPFKFEPIVNKLGCGLPSELTILNDSVFALMPRLNLSCVKIPFKRQFFRKLLSRLIKSVSGPVQLIMRET